MQFYLSSYKIGDKGEELARMIAKTKKPIGYIPNARDFTKADPVRNVEVTDRDLKELQALGIEAELLDLREYFGKAENLRSKLAELGGLWVGGGNTFVLRQAMKLSGLDDLLHEFKKRDDFVYGGYSAAGCVLSPTLEGYQIVDDPTDTPYDELREVLWDGLGLIDFTFLPHFDSDHPESADIDKEVAHCQKKGMPYKTLRDGEVLIIE